MGRASLAGGQPVLRALGTAPSPPCGLPAPAGPLSPAATAAAQPLAALRGHALPRAVVTPWAQLWAPPGAPGAGGWLHKAGAQCHPVTARGRLGQDPGSTRRDCCRRFWGLGVSGQEGARGKPSSSRGAL